MIYNYALLYRLKDMTGLFFFLKLYNVPKQCAEVIRHDYNKDYTNFILKREYIIS